MNSPAPFSRAAPPDPGALNDLILLIPVYNDWESLQLLLPEIDRALAGTPVRVRVLVVDDGSTQAPPSPWPSAGLRAISRVERLALRRNLGHQRAIAIGLCHVWEHCPCDAVLIMDGDGEDAPADVPRLMEKFRVEGGGSVVFAERTRRSETLSFRVCYQLYRAAHLALTGIHVKVGNFSLVPRAILGRLVIVSDLWNHYAAAVFKARLPHSGIATHRAVRLRGQSRMNFVALVVHGLSAVSVFSDLAGVRLLIGSGVVLLGALGALALTLGVRLLTGGDIGMWTAVGSGILLVLLLQVGAFALLACFITLGARNNSAFIPQRDYRNFVDAAAVLYDTDEHT
ncbi:MAG: glycosyltransferase [Verrucomicrobia bacterium]|nr:glycosyltransferase [Verrucomicrobiota bacterium]